MTVQIPRCNAVGVSCPITLVPVVELEHPVQVLPCKHIFDRNSIEGWKAQNPICPLDRRYIESMNAVVFVEDAKSGIEEGEDIKKTEALKRLEGTMFVSSALTQGFVNRAGLITVEYSQKGTRYGTSEQVVFTGAPIDQLYTEYSRKWGPVSLGNAHAAVTLSTHFDHDGACNGGGSEIKVI